MKPRKLLIAALLAVITVPFVSADEPFRLHRYDSFKAGSVTSQSIVFVGNSITNMGSWAETFGDDARCLNRGNSGAVSSETLENIESVLIGHPAKIFLMIGTNDIGSNYGTDVPFENVKAIIRRIQDESPETDIYLTSVFPSTVGTRTLPAISQLNELFRTLVDNDKIHYLDLYDDLMGITTGEISLDKLHIGPAGYKVWCDKAAALSGDTTLISSLISAVDMSSPSCGQGGSNGMRNQMFCELPSYSNDVWIFGDEMVNGGEWHEMLGLSNVKNRGWNWGIGGMYIADYVKALENMLTNDSDKMSKKAPKQIFFYVGTRELLSSMTTDYVKGYYRLLIDKAKAVAPDTKLYIMSLTPHWKESTNNLVKAYNESFKELADETNVTYVDIFTPLATEAGTPNADYLPSNYVYGKGYNRICQILAQYIDDAKVLSDEEFKQQYAVIDARNDLGKAVTSARIVATADGIDRCLKLRLLSQIDKANALLRSNSLNADDFIQQATTLTKLAAEAK
jgi:lysophospholipase L1-like esterase